MKQSKDRIIRDIRKLFKQEKEDLNKTITAGNFRTEIILNMKATEIEIKHYQWKNILIKLSHI